MGVYYFIMDEKYIKSILEILGFSYWKYFGQMEQQESLIGFFSSTTRTTASLLILLSELFSLLWLFLSNLYNRWVDYGGSFPSFFYY
jgi:hypothetical protein